MMRRWDVDPDRHSPDTRPAGSYDLVHEDDRSDVIVHNLTFPEAMLIATAHNAEVDSLPSRDEVHAVIQRAYFDTHARGSKRGQPFLDAATDAVLALLRGDTDE